MSPLPARDWLGADAGSAADPTRLTGAVVPSRRWTVFVHQDGIILSTTVRALAELGILQASLDTERCLTDLYPEVTPGGFGYLRVGLRCLASQGWLGASPAADPDSTVIRWTASGRLVAPYLDHDGHVPGELRPP
jgi:hypothetical protein